MSTKFAGARAAQKAHTRAQLLAAARRCFGRRGFAPTAIGEIAADAGVAHGTFYVHFASKEQVLDELIAELNAALAARLAPLWATAATAELRAVVAGTAAAFLDHCRDHRDLIAAYAERAAPQLTAASLRDGVNPPMAQLLPDALAALGVRGDARLIAHALLAMWLRVAMHYLFGAGVTRRHAVDTLTALTVGALGAVLPEDRP